MSPTPTDRAHAPQEPSSIVKFHHIGEMSARMKVPGMKTYASDAQHHTSQTAETMAHVRYEIDRIDRLLVEILAERQSFMDAAARSKGARGHVHDRPRIEDVVSKVSAAAKAAGLSVAIAEPVWRTLIDRCIAYEFESFDRQQHKTSSDETVV